MKRTRWDSLKPTEREQLVEGAREAVAECDAETAWSSPAERAQALAVTEILETLGEPTDVRKRAEALWQDLVLLVQSPGATLTAEQIDEAVVCLLEAALRGEYTP